MSEEDRCEECGGRFDRPGLFGCTEGHTTPTQSQTIAAAIERDIRSRRGLKGSFESIDDDIQDSIRNEWARLIDEILKN